MWIRAAIMLKFKEEGRRGYSNRFLQLLVCLPFCLEFLDAFACVLTVSEKTGRDSTQRWSIVLFETASAIRGDHYPSYKQPGSWNAGAQNDCKAAIKTSAQVKCYKV
jgi:hypothetical protein